MAKKATTTSADDAGKDVSVVTDPVSDTAGAEGLQGITDAVLDAGAVASGLLFSEAGARLEADHVSELHFGETPEPSAFDYAAKEFATKFPRLAAALEKWRSTSSEPPRAVRVVAKVDGFRRAGMAHPTTPVEHPIESFAEPDLLEALFAERQLTVDFV